MTRIFTTLFILFILVANVSAGVISFRGPDGSGQSEVVSTLTVQNLTALRLVSSNAGQLLNSTSLINWVAVANGLGVSDDGSGGLDMFILSDADLIINSSISNTIGIQHSSAPTTQTYIQAFSNSIGADRERLTIVKDTGTKTELVTNEFGQLVLHKGVGTRDISIDTNWTLINGFDGGDILGAFTINNATGFINTIEPGWVNFFFKLSASVSVGVAVELECHVFDGEVIIPCAGFHRSVDSSNISDASDAYYYVAEASDEFSIRCKISAGTRTLNLKHAKFILRR